MKASLVLLGLCLLGSSGASCWLYSESVCNRERIEVLERSLRHQDNEVARLSGFSEKLLADARVKFLAHDEAISDLVRDREKNVRNASFQQSSAELVKLLSDLKADKSTLPGSSKSGGLDDYLQELDRREMESRLFRLEQDQYSREAEADANRLRARMR